MFAAAHRAHRLSGGAIGRQGCAALRSVSGWPRRSRLRRGQDHRNLAPVPRARGDQLAALAQELVDLKVEAIATAASGVYAAHKVTKTVPIVVCAGGDLVALGLAESLAHPGGNITGSAILGPELVVKRTEFLKLVKPSIATLGLLMPRGSSATANYLRVLDAPTKALGLKVTLIEISNVDDCDRALAEGPGASVAALVVSDLIPDAAAVAAAAERRGLPTAGTFSFAKSGGLVGYGVDFPALYRRAAAFVDMILEAQTPPTFLSNRRRGSRQSST